MAKLYNLARVSTATTGTGTITLGSAVSGFLTFAQSGVANAEVVAYGIRDGANSEVGTGTYTTAGTTLTRTVSKSTNSDTAISLSGTAEVYITATKEDIANLREANLFTDATAITIGSVASVSVGGSSSNLQVQGGPSITTFLSNGATANGALFLGAKSRHATAGSHTVVNNGDATIMIRGFGSDGTDYEINADMRFEIDGTAANNDMPGRIVMSTTPDGFGSASLAERFRIDQAGNLIKGGLAAQTIVGFTPAVQWLGTEFTSSQAQVAYTGANTNSPNYVFAKSRHATVGSHTIVASGDDLGLMRFAGSNGTTFDTAAYILASVDGTPGASNDMPGRFVFATSADASTTPTERLRINSAGRLVAATSGQVAHFWVYWTGGSTSILASHNVASIDNDAAGDAGINLTTAFSSANYAAFVTTNETGTDGWDADSIQSCGINVHTAGIVDVLCGVMIDGTTAVGNLTNPDQWQACGFGVSA